MAPASSNPQHHPFLGFCGSGIGMKAFLPGWNLAAALDLAVRALMA
jgi:hypothetical protein